MHKAYLFNFIHFEQFNLLFINSLIQLFPTRTPITGLHSSFISGSSLSDFSAPLLQFVGNKNLNDQTMKREWAVQNKEIGAASHVGMGHSLGIK